MIFETVLRQRFRMSRSPLRIPAIVAIAIILICGPATVAAAQSTMEKPTIVPTPNHWQKFEAFKRRISDLESRGKLDEAVAAADEFVAAARAEGEDSIPYADALAARAWMHIDLSEYDEAKLLLSQSLTIFERRAEVQPEVNQFVARILNNLGQWHQLQDGLDEAEHFYDRALRLQEASLDPKHLDLATTLANIGYIHLLRRNFSLAERLLRRALDIRRNGEQGPAEPTAIALTLQSLASALEGLGRVDEAEASLREAVALRRASQSPLHAHLAGSLQRLGVNLHRQRKLKEADKLLDEALAIRRKSGQLPLDLAINLVDFGKLRIDQRRYKDADTLLIEAIETYQRVLPEAHSRIAEAYFHRATVAEALRNPTDALRWSREASRRFEVTGLSDSEIARVAFQGHVHTIWAAAHSLHKRPAADLVDEAFKYAQLAAATITAKSITQMAARMASGDPTLQAMIRRRQDLERRLAIANRQLMEALSTAERQAGAPEIRTDINAMTLEVAEIDETLRQDFPDYFSLVRPDPLTVREAQNVGDDEALLFVFETFDDVFVWTFTKEGVDWRLAAIKSDELKSIVAAMKAQLNQGPDDDVEIGKPSSNPLFDISAAHDLYRRLLGDSEAAFKTKKHLLVATSGALTGLPLHVLVRTKPKDTKGTQPSPEPYRKADWLARSFAISNLPSLTSLRTLPNGTTSVSDARKPLLGFANPIYQLSASTAHSEPQRGSTTRGARVLRSGKYEPFVQNGVVNLGALRALGDLKDTETELRAVAESLGAGDDDIVLREKASETTVNAMAADKRLHDYRVIYFAMHGLAPQPGNGLLEPALAMTVPESVKSDDDGLLSLADIMRLDLNADWVVLSACDTAAGDSFGADALSGLTRAFFYAGARSVLVTKWGVASTDARDLMIETFAAMKADPAMRRAEALRRSMLKQIDGPVAGRDGYWAAYPGYWGPFDLVVGTK